ncbi:MAG: hypothetical protein Q8755_02930, partial [Candidatus Phytoplasma australasiaticum]|nr:hypothetical protein [Candidatus Phytoplasma australasiaticum]
LKIQNRVGSPEPAPQSINLPMIKTLIHRRHGYEHFPITVLLKPYYRHSLNTRLSLSLVVDDGVAVLLSCAGCGCQRQRMQMVSRNWQTTFPFFSFLL